MTVMTSNEYKVQELMEQLHDAYMEDALESFYLDAEAMVQTVEHFVDDDTLCVDINSVEAVAKVIGGLLRLGSFYEFYTDDEQLLEFDFYNEAVVFLSDHLGYDTRYAE